MIKKFKASIVNMPFFSAKRPSIQLGLLQSIGEKNGFSVVSHSLNLEFANIIGIDLYEKLCRHRGRLLGDWLFSREAFGEDCPDPDAHFLSVIYEELPFLLDYKENEIEEVLLLILRIREVLIPKFIKEVSEREIWQSYKVAGFTSTFQQTTAALALARALKAKNVDLITIFGGANFDGEMGIQYLKQCDFIDYICVGEGDEAFPAFLDAVKNHKKIEIDGIYSRQDIEQGLPIKTNPVKNLDKNPIPNYDEYFSKTRELKLFPIHNNQEIDIPFESSRGCWWGEKHHCTFCGLNGSTMKYRRKSEENVLKEIFSQSIKYQSFNFEAVDNIIDMNYLKSFFPHLRENNFSFNFFYETKANLTKDQIQLLAESGVKRIQPGIESFSQNVLDIMDKGVKAIHNISLLKWCRHYNMDVMWNLIWGFPYEREDDYEDQAKLIPFLYHLQPPVGGFRIWLERFSPLFFNEKFEKKTITPEISYSYIYPPDFHYNEIAYFFHFEFENALPSGAYKSLAKEIENWQKIWKYTEGRLSLQCKIGHRYVKIFDDRNESLKTFEFFGEEAELFLYCHEQHRSINSIARKFNQLSSEKIQEILGNMVQLKIVVTIDDYYLSLATPYIYEYRR